MARSANACRIRRLKHLQLAPRRHPYLAAKSIRINPFGCYGILLPLAAWLIAFLIGALTLPFGLWIRSKLPETIHLRETGAGAIQHPERRSAVRANTRLLTLGLLIVASGTIITYVTQLDVRIILAC
jgi:hypothetical protein